ncbi:MAG TPA: hypothetical protein VHG10_13310 [Glycomyces sp.]|nr:hypothetical protein [Glycomyces sp.]
MRAWEDDGVLVVSGDEWFSAEPTVACLRLNYSGIRPSAFRGAGRSGTPAL